VTTILVITAFLGFCIGCSLLVAGAMSQPRTVASCLMVIGLVLMIFCALIVGGAAEAVIPG
jgi:hypothetical protein